MYFAAVDAKVYEGVESEEIIKTFPD